MMRNFRINTIVFLFALHCNQALSAEFVYPTVEPNIPNGSLQQLPYRTSDHTIPYGDDPLQFGELWLGESLGRNWLPDAP